MLDIGWSELLVIAVVLIVVVGPKELPGVLRTFGKWMGKARSLSREFQNNLNQLAREVDEEKKVVAATPPPPGAAGATAGSETAAEPKSGAGEASPTDAKTGPEPPPAADGAAKADATASADREEQTDAYGVPPGPPPNPSILRSSQPTGTTVADNSAKGHGDGNGHDNGADAAEPKTEEAEPVIAASAPPAAER